MTGLAAAALPALIVYAGWTIGTLVRDPARTRAYFAGVREALIPCRCRLIGHRWWAWKTLPIRVCLRPCCHDRTRGIRTGPGLVNAVPRMTPPPTTTPGGTTPGAA